MTAKANTTSVKGGFVKRNAKTGLFMEVTSGKQKAVSRPKTVTVVKEASTKRSAALKRLANR